MRQIKEPHKINPLDYGIKFPNQEIILGKNILTNFIKISEELKPNKKALIVTDENIYKSCIKNLSPIKNHELLILDKNTHAYKIEAEKISKNLNNKDYIIAIGSGTINDLAKYASFKNNKEYIIFATAPSMNGYLSGNSSLIDKTNIKTSYKAKPPIAAFFDLDILKNAPLRLIKSGIGDIICNSCIRSDWLLSHYLLRTKYSELPFNLIKNLEKKLYSNIEKTIERNEEYIELLTKILIFGGLSMYFIGNSNPASQAEHMIAHLYEMLDNKKATKSYHGEQITITTKYMTKLQDDFLENNKAPILKGTKQVNYKHLNKEIKEKLLNKEKIEEINNKLKTDWPKIREHINKDRLNLKQIEELINKAELVNNYQDLNWNQEKFKEACQYAHLTRNRFTFLDLKYYSLTD